MSKIDIVVGDITESDCECIVNAANNSLLGGGGVDGAIHRAAGPGLLDECRMLGGCATGDAKITCGHKLRAKYVIHTVGPIYGSSPRDAELLKSCYLRSLITARLNNIHSIAFPAISTGAYGYPRDEAARIALDTVSKWLHDNANYDMRVVFYCFDTAMRDCYARVMNG